MHRLAPALAIALALASSGPARAQQSTPAQPPASGSQQQPSGAAPSDEVVRAAVAKELEKVKEQLRDEVRAEMQGAQSAREFLDFSQEETKLEFFQLDGYLRLRTELFDDFDLNREADPTGNFIFPGTTERSGTVAMANMRLRLEPTLNVSEQVRVHAQVDLFDNLVLGSTNAVGFEDGVRIQLPPSAGTNSDRDSIRVKRAWADVQTPLGVLTFGRMPSHWGVGMLSHAGNGFDDDFGDTVDRIQFALPLGSSPIGQLTVVPMIEFADEGVLQTQDDARLSTLAQLFDAIQSDDGRMVGVKVARIDTDEEQQLKFEKSRASWNYGVWYQYRTQKGRAVNDPSGPLSDASAHVVDLWTRFARSSFRLEGELVGVYGSIDSLAVNPGAATPTLTGPVLLRQFGGVLQSSWKPGGKVTIGGETGVASGDTNPGFGVRTLRPSARGVLDARQFTASDDVKDIRNFRFNRAYRVDLILWREILLQVTDAFYVKPSVRYELIQGLGAELAVIYSQAIYAGSTPGGKAPLGIEGDVGAFYESDDGFLAWIRYGLLQPLGAFDSEQGRDLHRAHAIRGGFGVKF
jgi:uncharacterized protein (TIGR04551 family)